MKKNILIFGLTSGLILSVFIILFTWLGEKYPKYAHSEVTGYAAMIIAFSFIFVGVKNFRDKYNHGIVSFGKAFRIGLGITLIASTLYVIAWMIAFYIFIPDFMEKYADHLILKAQDSGVSPAALTKKVAEINNMRQLYKNPLFVALFTYLEVLPVGIIISLLTAFILRRRQPRAGVQIAA